MWPLYVQLADLRRTELADAQPGSAFYDVLLTDNPPPMFNRVVFINLESVEERVTSVMMDYEAAAFRACRYLIDLGYQRIGYIGGPPDRLFAQQRFRGFRKALAFHHRDMQPEP